METTVRIGNSSLELVEGDITAQKVDAIVNAANSHLAGGGGVDGAIHRAGGPAIMAECRAIGGCPTGQAVATTAGNLDARKIIHAVGPVYRGGGQEEASLLASAYRSAFHLAADEGLQTIATCSLSTGAFAYPVAEAARIALATAMEFLAGQAEVRLIRFVLFGPETYHVYRRILEEIAPTQAMPSI